ncbi:MAG: serine O-acetyltransferase [Rhizobacter sp.]
MTATFWQAAQADLFRMRGSSSAVQALWAALTRRCYRPLFTLRLCQALQDSSGWRWLLPLALLSHRAARHLAGLDLPWRTCIAPGVRIDHGWGLVINAAAVVGRNCTLFHGVTLGQRDRIAADGSRSTGVPVIEDEVWIGPHAVIVGGITIGRGSRIAAGAFVTQDVPPHSLVVGNPAQVVQQDVPPDVENPWRG